ncbi:MAG: ABC transporter permease [Bryobacteraceae bacterium]|nr:ABC transporter permease [Bryobacteraceae bacterium]MDW8377413.1 hypothetical protein [Bryobacterales bacterium]
MLWYKSWLELRFRLFWLLFLLLALACFLVVWSQELASGNWEAAQMFGLEPGKLGAAGLPAEQVVALASGLFVLALILAPVGALMLAGSGMNTQTNYGMTPGFHGSMLYTLSLPVTRRQLLWTRAALGGLCYLAFVLLCLAFLLGFYRLSGISLSWSTILAFLPGLLVGSLFYYSLAVFLSAVFDEFWSSMIGFFLVGLLGGYSIASGATTMEITSLMRGVSLLRGQEWPYLAAALWIAAAIVLILAASWWVERREI